MALELLTSRHRGSWWLLYIECVNLLDIYNNLAGILIEIKIMIITNKLGIIWPVLVYLVHTGPYESVEFFPNSFYSCYSLACLSICGIYRVI